LQQIDYNTIFEADRQSFQTVMSKIDSLETILMNVKDYNQIPDNKHFESRKDILIISKTSESLFKKYNETKFNLTEAGFLNLQTELNAVKSYTEYSPNWVILLISVSLGMGTMIGWKKVVVTIGEKIGKQNMNYAQGATAQIIAASTIGASTLMGLPVSTTHVLSSGIAGTMVAGKGKGNLQMKTVRNIAIAWLITLPVTIIMAGLLFLLFRLMLG
jgi:PiT family inorganic phosphate transporter